MSVQVLDPVIARMPVARGALVTQGELQRLIGTPYTDEHDCYWFVRHFFGLEGYEIAPDIYKAVEDFRPVEPPARYLDVAYFKTGDPLRRHVAVMLDDRYALQSSAETNVARVDVCRSPWPEMFVGLYRHKSRCC